MFGSNRVLTLNLGSGKVVLAEFQVKPGAPPVLLDYGTAPMPKEAEEPLLFGEAVGETIKSLLEAKGMRPAPVMVSIAGMSVFPRFVTLPAVSDAELPEMMRAEAEQNVPFPINEVVWDYSAFSSDDLGGRQAMIVAAKEETIRNVVEAVKQAGLEPSVIDIAPLALYRTLRFGNSEEEGCSLIVDIGARSTNLIFSEEGKVFLRSIPVAGQAITQELAKTFNIPFDEAEELKCNHAFVSQGGVYTVEDQTLEQISKVVRTVMTRLHAEINRSINFYRSQQSGSPPVRIFLTGGSAVMPHMDAFFQEKCGVEVTYLNPFANVGTGNALPIEELEKDAFFLGEVVGLAIRKAHSSPVEVNLLPEDELRARTLQSRIPVFLAAGIGLCLSLGVWTLYMEKRASQYEGKAAAVERQLSALDAQNARLRKIDQTRQAQYRKATFVANILQARGEAVEHVAALRDCLFRGLWISELSALKDASTDTVVGVKLIGHAWLDRMAELEASQDTGAEGNSRLTPVEQLCDRLRRHPAFGKEKDDVRIVTEGETGAIRNFTIEARYANAPKPQLPKPAANRRR
ncbi:MAG: type IV pilus assembly protein PilM [Kiritimatiellia bacterium]|nr:type IV pilus assembly protein PilM [Kiritimatiellia bacterium]